MTRQTKVTNKTVPMMLLFFLSSVGASAPAGSANGGKPAVSADAVVSNAGDPVVGGRVEDSPAGHAPASTAAQLEALRQNGKQQAAEAAFTLAVGAIERNDFAAAQTLIREAMQLQPSNPGYLQGAAGLAFLKGELADAEAYQVRSLELARSALGTDDIRIADLMDDLGAIYLAQRNYTQAERTWRESLAIREQVLGSSHPSLAPRLTDLAGLAMHAGRFEETERLLKRALQIMQAAPGTDRTDVATAMHNLADFYVGRQRGAEAEALYREALAVWKAAPAQRRLQVAASLNQLGNEYLAQRRLAGAGTQFELVIKLLEEDFGHDHRYVRTARTVLDKLKSEQQKLGERKEFDQRLFEELRSQFSRRSQTM